MDAAGLLRLLPSQVHSFLEYLRVKSFTAGEYTRTSLPSHKELWAEPKVSDAHLSVYEQRMKFLARHKLNQARLMSFKAMNNARFSAMLVALALLDAVVEDYGASSGKGL